MSEKSLSDLMADSKNSVYERLPAALKAQIDNFAAEENADSLAAGGLQMHHARVDEATMETNYLTEVVQSAKAVDIGGNLLTGVSNNPGGIANLTAYAANYSGVVVLQLHGDKLIKASELKLKTVKDDLQAFIVENKARLVKLKLI